MVISEDASRLKAKVIYDIETNSLVGLVGEMDPVTGLPLHEQFVVKLPSEMVKYLEEFKRAKYVELIMAEPFADGATPYVLGFFPTNNDYTAQQTVNRWQFIAAQMFQRGIKVFLSSDGAAQLFCAQKFLNGFGQHYDFCGYRFVADPKSFQSTSIDKIPALQDPLHLTNKMKNRMFDPTNHLVMGDYIVSSSHLQILCDNPRVSKYDHQLTQTIVGSDVTKDKMNTIGTEKICRPVVVELLKKFVVSSEGTQIFLELMDNCLEAFTRHNVPARIRLFKGVYTLEFVRRWMADLIDNHQGYDSGITKHCHECLELNVAFLLQLVLTGTAHLAPMCSSQACEKAFRLLRSFSPMESTMINFTMFELITQLKRVKMMSQFSSDLQSSGFVFNEKHVKTVAASGLSEKLSEEDCRIVIEEAVASAAAKCIEVGIETTRNELIVFKPVNLNRSSRGKSGRTLPVESEESDDDDEDDSGAVEIGEHSLNNEMNIFKYRNVNLIEEESIDANFKMCADDGTFVRVLKKSTLLWTIQDDPDRVSTDRLMRFHSRKGGSAFVYIWEDNGTCVFRPNGVKRGQWIVLSIKGQHILGQALKFGYEGKKTKTDRRYTYDAVIFGVNEGVSVLLSPSFQLGRTGQLSEKESFSVWFKLSAYVCHIRDSAINLDNFSISRQNARNVSRIATR